MLVQPTLERLEVGRASSVPIRLYRGASAQPPPLVLHLPGGAFTGLPAERPVASLLAEAGAVVISADYPIGAAHPFPDAVEAMYALLRHLHDRRACWAARASKLFVAGEEAGGTLAAALAMMARDRLGPPVAGQILLSPMLDPGMGTCSFRDAEAGPVGCKWADGWTVYLGCPDKAAHPYAAPSSGSRLHGLPPALVITTPDDPMRDECLAYAGHLMQAGVAIHMRAIAAHDWPDALAGPVPPGPPPAWAGVVRRNFADFFAAVTPPIPARPTDGSVA